jgi:hypothetical protein
MPLSSLKRDEPQAVIGSEPASARYPKQYEEHVKDGMELEEAYEHKANGEGA